MVVRGGPAADSVVPRTETRVTGIIPYVGWWGSWRARHPKRYAGSEWSTRDSLIVGVALSLFAMGGVQREFIWLSLVLWTAGGAWWVTRYVRRKRRERIADATSEFWRDRIDHSP